MYPLASKSPKKFLVKTENESIEADKLIIATGGAAATVIAGSATTTVTLFGATGAQTVAIGALAYNFVAIVIAPFFGVEMEPIEYPE